MYLLHCVVESFDSLMQNTARVKRYTVQRRVKFGSGESSKKKFERLRRPLKKRLAKN